MNANDTQNATIDIQALERRREASPMSAMTLVFRWDGGRQLVDMDRARALTVGRGSACDLQIDDPSLSRQHARFVREGDALRVEDLGARNGVTVSGRRVERAQLESGEVVMLGHVSVSVHIFAQPSVPAETPPQDGDINWAGQGMAELRRELQKIAPTPLPVLVLGETGCGKELIAREIHRLSTRTSAPLRIVNCAAIPSTLIESTLFGHERGAFTGADRAQAGVFEQASGGTIFLDELGELSAAAQAALLRVLETGCFTRVGGARELSSDARVVAATHRDLHAMVERGEFRLDLLHRLDAVSVRLPPLRERIDALPSLVQMFLERACKTMNKSPRRVSADAMAVLRAYGWPGNVRELRNVIERAVAIAEAPLIGVADLPDRVRNPESIAAPQPIGAAAAARPTAMLPPAPGAAAPAGVLPSIPAGASLKDKHAQEERDLLVRALEQARGDQTAAAAMLGWSLRTLQRRVQHYGLSRPRK